MTAAPHTSERRGRPALTSARHLAEVARALFVERGYEETTVEDIAAAAGVNKRTFFRYFTTKADTLWVESDAETALFGKMLAETPGDVPWADALREAALASLAYRPVDQTWMLHRALLVANVPAVRERATTHMDTYRNVATEFVAARRGTSTDDLVTIAAGHAALSALMGSHQYWTTHPDEDLGEVHERFLRLLLPAVE